MNPDGDAGISGDREVRLRDLALDTGPVAQLVLDAGGTVLMVNALGREMFSLGPVDLGRRLHDLEISHLPVELRSRIDRARRRRHPVSIAGVERHLDRGRVQFLEVVVTPLFDEDGAHLGATVAFVDVTSERTLCGELQSTVEEVETTSEELQVAGRELEAMNEELRSTDGELQSVTIELRERTVELDRLNAFMESLLNSLRVAVVVVDTELQVQTWNSRAEDLWGLRSDEVVGRSLLRLDIGLPVDHLAAPLRRCVSGDVDGDERVVQALDRRGRTIECLVTFSPLLEHGVRRGAVVLMEEARADAPD